MRVFLRDKKVPKSMPPASQSVGDKQKENLAAALRTACNFLTFPILVLLIYVRYNWYSIDTHVQRVFFSAVGIGVLDITEVSVMGDLYLVTEFEDTFTR